MATRIHPRACQPKFIRSSWLRASHSKLFLSRYSIILALWVTAYLLRAVFLFFAARKNRLGELPIFFSYVGYTILETIIALSIRYHEYAYHRITAFITFTGVLLEILVIYELAERVFSRSPLHRRFQRLKTWILAPPLLMATAATAVLPQQMPWNRMVVNVDFFADVLELGLLMILLLVGRIVGVSWPVLPAGVALGLGFCAGVDAAGDTVFGQWGSPVACDIIEQSVSVLTAVLWLVCVFLPQKAALFKETDLAAENVHREAAQLGDIVRTNILSTDD